MGHKIKLLLHRQINFMKFYKFSESALIFVKLKVEPTLEELKIVHKEGIW